MVELILYFVLYIGYRYLFERKGKTGTKYAFAAALLALATLPLAINIAIHVIVLCTGGVWLGA